MSGVPLEWVRMQGNLRVALIERDAMKTASGVAHDEAVDRYVRAVDRMIDDLGLMQTRLVLGEITQFLAARERV